MGCIFAAAVLAWTAASNLGAATTGTVTASATPSALPVTVTATLSPTDSATPSVMPSATPSATASVTDSATATPSATDSFTPTATSSATPNPTATASATPPPTGTSSATVTPSPALTATPGPALTATPAPGLEDPHGETYAYPNPARDDVVNVVFRIDGPGEARLRVFQSAAEPAAQLTEHYDSAGVKSLAVPLDGFARGLYFYKVDFHYDDGRRDKRPLGKFVRSTR